MPAPERLRVQSQQSFINKANNEIKTINDLITLFGETSETKRLMKNVKKRLITYNKIINDETFKTRRSENAKIKRQIKNQMIRDTVVVHVPVGVVLVVV
jgi:hypothetical protein